MDSIIKQTLRRRPWTSFGVSVVGGTLGCAGLLEFYSDYQERNCVPNNKDGYDHHQHNCLPRTYDRQTIRNYWIKRPISVLTRFGYMGYELSPIVTSYLYHKLYLCNDRFFPLTTTTVGGDGNDDETQRRDHNNRQTMLDESTRRQAIQLREALTNLGPAFVKAGQQLAIRPDLLPPTVLKELQKLCDSVRPIPDDVALGVLKDELGLQSDGNTNRSTTTATTTTATTTTDLQTSSTTRTLEDVFDDIHLVASASLGQVYKARIRQTGDVVAIKVQRPGMQRAFSLDLFLLQWWGDFMDAFTSTFTKQIPFHRTLFDAFSKGSYSELDYENEARNQIHFQHELAKRKCKVKVPNVYEEYSTQRVLTTEWIEGNKLADAPGETIRELIPIGVELFLTQLLDIGAFHSDPHPGNLLVTEDGGLCLLDFGLCAEVDDKSREAMTKAIVHLLYRDFDSLIHSDTKELGFLPVDFDTEELKPILTKILTGGLLESGSDLKKRKRKLMEISNELNEVFFRYPFQVPGFFALVTRGLGLLEGIALVGDPDFDIFMASAPYATKRAVSILGKQGYRRMSRAMTRGTKYESNRLS